MSDQTFEQLWKRIQLYAPNCPTPLAQEFINTAYSHALTWDRWGQLRLEFEYRLPVVYNTGQATTVDGSTTVLGVGTAWTAPMVNRQFMVDAITPMYTIEAINVTTQTITLDRPYHGLNSGTRVYEIGQYFLEVPSDFLTWDIIRDVDNNWKLHTNFQQRQIDVWDTKRQITGVPWVVALAPPRTPTTPAGSVPVKRYEFWPRPSPGPKTYACRYIRRPTLLTNDTDRPIFPIRGDVLRKGALAELALWPGTTTVKNPYYSLENHSKMQLEFRDGLNTCWKDDQEVGQTAIIYDDWEGVPYAPIDARYLQSHDIF